MTKITAQDFIDAFNSLSTQPIQKQEWKLFETKQHWLKVKPFGIEWTNEQLDNAIDGYIGEQKGIKCYLTPLF